MEMDMPNMPVKMPAMESVRCVTPEQAKDPANALLRDQRTAVVANRIAKSPTTRCPARR